MQKGLKCCFSDSTLFLSYRLYFFRIRLTPPLILEYSRQDPLLLVLDTLQPKN